MKVGLVGLGRMGRAIAERLAGHGFDVIAWDRNLAAVAAAQGQNIGTANSPCAVAEAAEVVISIITDDHGVRAIFTGPDGFLQAKVSGKLFIEMSTLQPMTARELAPLVEAQGARLVDSPVLGTIPAVREGTLLSLAGGRAEDIDRAKLVLGKLTRRVEHMGPHGAGYAMKLAVNLGLGVYIQAVAESLALGLSQGLPLEQVLGVLKEAPYASPWLQNKVPVLLGSETDVTLDIRTMRKDLMSALATGALAGIPMAVTSGALVSFSAAVAAGAGARDLADIARVLRERMLQDFL